MAGFCHRTQLLLLLLLPAAAAAAATDARVACGLDCSSKLEPSTAAANVAGIHRLQSMLTSKQTAAESRTRSLRPSRAWPAAACPRDGQILAGGSISDRHATPRPAPEKAAEEHPDPASSRAPWPRQEPLPSRKHSEERRALVLTVALERQPRPQRRGAKVTSNRWRQRSLGESPSFDLLICVSNTCPYPVSRRVSFSRPATPKANLWHGARPYLPTPLWR